MASSNILLFDQNKANMMIDSDYSSNQFRVGGVQTGIASSSLQNKFQYQVSLVAYAIAQMMVNNGYDAKDSSQVSTFVSNLSSAVLQKIVDKATTEQAQAGTNTTKWMSPALTKAAIEAILWSKSNILSEETKELFGLSSSSNPNDVFEWIGKYNTYCWTRQQATIDINKSNIQSNVTVSIGSSGLDVTYSTDVDEHGNLVNPSILHLTRDASSASNIVSNAPCYYTFNDAVYFIPNGATSGSTSSTVYYNSSSRVVILEAAASVKAQAVSVNYSIIGDLEVVFSANRNEYPDSGFYLGYDYSFRGVPFDELAKSPKVYRGSYIGTGTYGISNPNSIEFGFVPKLLVVKSRSLSSSIIRGGFPWIYGSSLEISSLYYSSDLVIPYVHITWGTTVSWYETNGAMRQLNESGTTYDWIAIC